MSNAVGCRHNLNKPAQLRQQLNLAEIFQTNDLDPETRQALQRLIEQTKTIRCKHYMQELFFLYKKTFLCCHYDESSLKLRSHNKTIEIS